jgi:hypothetical protein
MRTNRMKGDNAMSKPRTGIPAVPGLGNVVNGSAWGEAKAVERYGSLVDSNVPGGGTRIHPPPEDRHTPQKLGDANNLQGPNYQNIVPSNSWLRGGGAKQGESKPNFHPGYKGKK